MIHGYLVTLNNSATYGCFITFNGTQYSLLFIVILCHSLLLIVILIFSPKKLENYLREQKIMITFAGILC